MKPDVYFKKLVSLKHGGQDLELRVAQDLFSSHQVDVGTRRLLRSLSRADTAALSKVLDLGCGYGPLGLALKSEEPDCGVHLVDRDALALSYARQNARLNGLEDVEVYGSLGYDEVTFQDFDLIVSNIPGKVGTAVIEALLRDAVHYLQPDGWVALVIVAPLAPLVDQVLAQPGFEVLLREERSGHAVFHYRFTQEAHQSPRPEGTAFERGLYDRAEVRVEFEGLSFGMRTVWGLPEFDTLSYRTEMLVERLQAVERRAERVLVFNPGQGHVPVAVWELDHPRVLTLVDRDLLALRASERNLLEKGLPTTALSLFHQPELDVDSGPYDLIAGVLREEEGREVLAFHLEEAAAQLAEGGRVLLAGTSTPITRLEKEARSRKLLRVLDRRKERGRSLLVLERR
jgi:16S rRNA (guanine1207-N2)-methyltransferase